MGTGPLGSSDILQAARSAP